MNRQLTNNVVHAILNRINEPESSCVLLIKRYIIVLQTGKLDLIRRMRL